MERALRSGVVGEPRAGAEGVEGAGGMVGTAESRRLLRFPSSAQQAFHMLSSRGLVLDNIHSNFQTSYPEAKHTELSLLNETKRLSHNGEK